MGNKNEEDRRDHSNTQGAAPHSPPLSNYESRRRGRIERKPLCWRSEHQNSLQSVTCNNSPKAARSNSLQPAKSIYSDPLNPQITELHLNKIGRALNEFELKKNSSHIGNSSALEFSKSRPHASMENITTIPASKGNISAAFNSNLYSELNTHKTINSAYDNQGPRASMFASKP